MERVPLREAVLMNLRLISTQNVLYDASSLKRVFVTFKNVVMARLGCTRG